LAKVKLSKSALQEQRNQLRLYEKLLPSLDLKRRQLLAELKKAQDSLEQTRAATSRLEAGIGAELPMIAAAQIPLGGLLRVTGVRVGVENIAGVKVPRLEGIDCDAASYSMLAKPAWVDRLVDRLRGAAEQRLRLRVEDERVRVLERAVRRITQRVNLFGRILIPRAKQNIKRIRIYLGDLEREGVIRSKLSKARHLRPVATRAESP
jgi:V/A-type H+-transporting ATPase subunit D